MLLTIHLEWQAALTSTSLCLGVIIVVKNSQEYMEGWRLTSKGHFLSLLY